MSNILTYEVWISRFSSSLSILGSSAIIYIICSAYERKLANPKNRFMLLMSIFDVLQSAAILVGPAAIPKDTGVYGAFGNSATCTAQSILMTIGLAVPSYNFSLNVFYLLIIRYNMTQARFSRNIEPFLHAFSVVGPLSSAVILAALGYTSKPSGTACVFEGKVPLYAFCALIIPSFIFCIYSMGSISLSVINQGRRVKRHRFAASNTNNASILEVKETIKQALLYSFAFLLTFLFAIIYAFVNGLDTVNHSPLLRILRSLFYPLQGFFNFIFYIRPGINHSRKLDPNISLMGAMRQVIFNAENMSRSPRHTPLAAGIAKLRSPKQVKKSPAVLSIKEGITDSVSDISMKGSKTRSCLNNDDADNKRSASGDSDESDESDDSDEDNFSWSEREQRQQKRASFVNLSSIMSDISSDNLEEDITNEKM